MAEWLDAMLRDVMDEEEEEVKALGEDVKMDVLVHWEPPMEKDGRLELEQNHLLVL